MSLYTQLKPTRRQRVTESEIYTIDMINKIVDLVVKNYNVCGATELHALISIQIIWESSKIFIEIFTKKTN